MIRSARTCLVGARQGRWLRALRLLGADSIFADADLADLVEAAAQEPRVEVLRQLSTTFILLSSGHKIVLLTITSLRRPLKRSLVLLDEPAGGPVGVRPAPRTSTASLVR